MEGSARGANHRRYAQRREGFFEEGTEGWVPHAGTIDVGADLPDVAIDEDPLRQIVLNLALNALEATPEGGKVRLAAVYADAADDARAPDAVEFIVDDEGPGVREEDRARLFDPFFSTRSERPVGLGLTVCSRLARESTFTSPLRSSAARASGAALDRA